MLFKYIGIKKYYNDALIASPNDILDIYQGHIYNVTSNTNIDVDEDLYNTILKDCKKTNNKMKTNNKVEHPSHYIWLKEKCGIEVIDITRNMDFDLGNAIKYILRAGRKHEDGYDDKSKTIEDLKKAIWYINDEINMLENA